MQITAGEIFIAPKLVYWVEMPKTLGQNLVLELLKRDILVLECPLPEVEKKKNDQASFLYNLDGIIQKTRSSDAANIATLVRESIQKQASHLAMVHTQMINSALKQKFGELKITYIERNLSDEFKAIDVLPRVVPVLFSKLFKNARSYLRMHLHPQHKIRAEIFLQGKKISDMLLKDLSINGIGILSDTKASFERISVKDFISIKLYFARNIVIINNALVSRKDNENQVLGVSYDINDKRILSKEDSDVLIAIIHKWLKQLLAMLPEDDLNFQKIEGSKENEHGSNQSK